MTRLLPALHQGHAPINLHYAFEEALEAFEGWGLGMSEPEVEFDGRSVPISSVFGRMRACSDIMPQRTLDLLSEVVGDRAATFDRDGGTYAEAAFLLRALCVERLRDEAA